MSHPVSRFGPAIGPEPTEAQSRASIIRGSAALLQAINLQAGKAWPCGHFRTAENTHRGACKVCRRARWRRGFKIVVARRKLALAVERRRNEILRQNRQAQLTMQGDHVTRCIRHPGNGKLPFDQLLAMTCALLELTPDEIKGTGRKPRMVGARCLLTRILRERGLSYPTIARLLGKVDHSSAIHWMKCFDKHVAHDPRILPIYEMLKDRPC
jgi:hypothetical protein